MARVAILVGSKSDLPAMQVCKSYLEHFGIEYELQVLSAHRNPQETAEFAQNAHLAGAIAAHTTLPVIGVPMAGSSLNGLDALLSTVQMPTGVPVATMAIGSAGAANAAILAAQIFAVHDEALNQKLLEFKKMGSRL